MKNHTLILSNTCEMAEVILSGPNAKKQFFDIIKNAEGSWIILGSYKLQPNQLPDPAILNALNIVTKNGLAAQLILESRITKEEIKGVINLPINAALKAFQNTGARVITNLEPFKNVHLKLLLTEDTAVIGTTNYDDPDTTKRDFSLVLNKIEIINEIKNTLEALIQGKELVWPSYSITNIMLHESRLTWGPIQHKSHIIEMIRSAQKEISIYQQSLQDDVIVEELAKIVKERNIDLKILMSHYPFSKNHPNGSLENLKKLYESGAHVRLTGEKILNSGNPLHIHAKVLLIDGNTLSAIMYLGSANFYGPVLNPDGGNLNLGIITKESNYINPVQKTFHEDWVAHEGYDFTL